MPLEEFYRELVSTQAVINRKHLGLRTAVGALRILGGNLARGQANFARMRWKFKKVYNPDRQYAEHHRPVRYELPLPRPEAAREREYEYQQDGDGGRPGPAARDPVRSG